MAMGRNRSIWATAALVLLGVAAPTFAQQVSDARIRELLKQAAANAGGLQTPQGTQTAPAPAAGPTVRMTLEDAVKAALDHNLDIAVQRLNPEIQDISYASLISVYRPVLTSAVAGQSQTNASTSTVSGGGSAGAPIGTGQETWNGGVSQAVPWGGGSLVATLNNNRATTESLNTVFNPTFNTLWTAAYTQPLMRGFKIDANRQGISVSKLNRDISDVQLRSTITNTVSNVRNAYWDYVFAVQSVQVNQKLVDLADQLVKDNQTRVQVGTMAPIDVVTAQSQAATQRQNLVAAVGTLRTNELALKRLVVGGTQDPLWSSTIDPVDRPDFRPEAIDLEAAVRRALNERTDLQIAKKNVDANAVTLRYLSNQLLPQADLVATFGTLGVGGTTLIKPTTGGVNAPPIGFIPGGYGDALSTMFGARALQYPRWNFTLNFSYPLGLSSAKATTARAQVQLTQDQAQIRQIELQVATDITNAVITVQNNAERVQAAVLARQLAQEQLNAENSKFEVGMSTNFLVVQAQNNLASAQNTELQNVLAYRKSLVELDRLQQTTLTSLNITLVSNVLR
jgi:outer membrane protein TolC